MGPIRAEPIGLIGVDEAGRGPLAGPCVVAAVRLPAKFRCPGLTDSKQLTPLQREEAFEVITATCEVAVEIAEVEDIDRLNILRATLEAMARAAMRLRKSGEEVWIDGNALPPLEEPVRAIVKGDATVPSISAASVIAKVTRDRLMKELASSFPGYGFESHFGYSTPEHFEALRRLGPCPIHRRSFSPIREMVNQPCLELGV